MAKYGNLSLECPEMKKGFRFLRNFTMDSHNFPTMLPVNIRLFFTIIVIAVKQIKRFRKMVRIVSIEFLGRVFNV